MDIQWCQYNCFLFITFFLLFDSNMILIISLMFVKNKNIIHKFTILSGRELILRLSCWRHNTYPYTTLFSHEPAHRFTASGYIHTLHKSLMSQHADLLLLAKSINRDLVLFREDAAVIGTCCWHIADMVLSAHMFLIP